MQIDPESQHINEKVAEQLLELLYQMYHGRNLDKSGRKVFVTIIRDRGFMGLAKTLNSIIHSDEMDDRVCAELDNLWYEHLGRTITTEERKCYEDKVRFFRQSAINEIINNINRAEQLRYEAAPYLNSGEFDKARVLLDQAVTYEPASWHVWHDHGLVRYRQEDYKSAIPSYQKAIRFNSDNHYFWSCEDLKWCYGNLGAKKSDWYKEGLAYFQDVIRDFSNRWIAYHECGWMLMKMGEFDKAIPYYLQAIEKQTDPTWGWSYFDLTDCYESQNKKNEALDYLTSVAEAGSKNWAVWHCLGNLQWKYLGNQTKAVESFIQSTEHHPDKGWFWTLQSKGWCHGDLRQYEDAFKAFEEANSKEPQNWHAWHAMGWAKEMSGKYDEAIPFFQKTLQLHKQHTWTWLGLARCFRKKSKPQYVNSWEVYQYALHYKDDNADTEKAREQGLEEIDNDHYPELKYILIDAFNPGELQSLCFDIGIPYSELEGSTHGERVMSLIGYCGRRRKLLQLIQQTRKERPQAIPVSILE